MYEGTFTSVQTVGDTKELTVNCGLTPRIGIDYLFTPVMDELANTMLDEVQCFRISRTRSEYMHYEF